MTFGRILVGVHYLLLAVCLGCVGLLMLVQGGVSRESDMMSWVMLTQYIMMGMVLLLPALFVWDAIGLAVKELGYRQYWGQTLVLDGMMVVLWVRGFILMSQL